MTNIVVLGGTGYGGAAVAAEAARRGHGVTSYSRRAPDDPITGIRYETGSLTDPDVLEQAVDGADVIFEALAPRGDMADRLAGVVTELMARCDEHGVRLGSLGGASSLLVADGGPRLFDVTELPEAVRPEVEFGLWKLAAFQQAPPSLDWFFVSPAEQFGSWLPQRVTGSYRTSDDVLLRTDDGESYVAAPDLALGVLDEIEQPRHHRRRFHIAL